MEEQILQLAQAWANNPLFDSAFRQEIQNLIDTGNHAELTDRFYQDLEFGTGGLRGIMGAGRNRMNLYTVRKATQGLANYIKKQGISEAKVAIAHDCRNNSKEFTKATAEVLAANGILAYLYDDLKPTPMLSYAVRYLKCTAGIVITASHNPKEYNGYKVYWSDGCQVTPPHDKAIIQEVNAVGFEAIATMPFEQGQDAGLIHWIDKDLEESYYGRVAALSQTHGDPNHHYGVIYTPLHGTGLVPMQEVFKRRGFNNFKIVPKQSVPDGNFTHAPSPNPEVAASMNMAKDMAGPEDYLILSTDPDADRIGCLCKHQGEWVALNGNQIGQVLLYYYLSVLKENGRLPRHGVYITTIVTSNLGAKIAEKFDLQVRECLTGFKWIGEIIRQLEETHEHFIFGTEESHGYLFSDFVRDKDGIQAAMFLAELAADLHQHNISLVDLLEQIYNIYGFHVDALVNKEIPGKEGADRIQAIMAGLRNHPPQTIGGIQVTELRDYQTQKIHSMPAQKETGTLQLPKSNVLAFYLADGSRITARPSGTEPKIKFYFNLTGADPQALEKQKRDYIEDFNKLIESY